MKVEDQGRMSRKEDEIKLQRFEGSLPKLAEVLEAGLDFTESAPTLVRGLVGQHGLLHEQT